MANDRKKLLDDLANALWVTWGERTKQPDNRDLEVLDNHISRAIIHAGFSTFELNEALNRIMVSLQEGSSQNENESSDGGAGLSARA